MPWNSTRRNSVFAAPGPSQNGLPHLPGGGWASGGSGGFGAVNVSGDPSFDQFVTGPFIPPPQGANLTGTSSLQRQFPERIGGNLLAKGEGNPITPLVESAMITPSRVGAQPVALADTITGGAISRVFGGEDGEGIPVLSNIIDFGGSIVENALSLPAALMNAQPSEVMSKLWNRSNDTLLTPELFQQVGLKPDMAGQFKKNGLPVLGWAGIGGEQMTVGELKAELEGRGFLQDPESGTEMSWEEFAAKVNGDEWFGTLQQGHAKVNEDEWSNLALQIGGQAVETLPLFLLTGGVAGTALAAAKASRLGVAALRGAQAIDEAASGVGAIAKVYGVAKPTFGFMIRAPFRLIGRPGDAAVSQLAQEGIIDVAAAGVEQGTIQLAAGSARAATAQSMAQFAKQAIKTVVYPNIKGASPLGRYMVGQTGIRAGSLAAEGATSLLENALGGEEHGIDVPIISQMHDFFESWNNNTIVSDDMVFATVMAFNHPITPSIKRVATPVTRPVGATLKLGREYTLPRSVNMIDKEFGPGTVEALGGKAVAAEHMDRMAQDIAWERRSRGLEEGVRAQWESIPEAATRMRVIHNSIRASAEHLIARGEITAHDLVQRFREVHENPIVTITRDDGTISRQPALPFRTRLSTDAIVRRANRYRDASQIITDPIVQMQTAVLGRSQFMTKETLDFSIKTLEDSAVDGTVSAQFIRDLFYETPGMLDDPMVSPATHDFFVEAMNPAHTAEYDAAMVASRLRELEKNAPTRDELWHELSQRDKAAPPATNAQGDVGMVSNGVARNVHSQATANRFVSEADGQIKSLKKQREEVLARRRSLFSKRGNRKPSQSDLNWEAAGPEIAVEMAVNEVGHYSAVSGKPRNYKRGFDVPGERLGVVPEGDVAGMQSAARAVRQEYPGADVRFTPSIDTPGHLDVTGSYHFATLERATSKANELDVQYVYDSSRRIEPRVPQYPIIPVEKAILDEKAAEIASGMPNLTAEQAGAASELLTVMAQNYARYNGGSPLDYLNNLTFTRGGRRGAGALRQADEPGWSALLEGNGHGRSSVRKTIMDDTGRRLEVPTGKKAFSLDDAWHTKMQGINPGRLADADRIDLYQRTFEAHKGNLSDPVDNFRRAAFSMLSPNNNLTSNEIGFAALGIRTFEDIVRISKMSDDQIVRAIMDVNAGFKSVGAQGRAVRNLAKKMVQDPDLLNIRPGELPAEYITRIAENGGLNMKTANFAAMLSDPMTWPIGTVDVHVARELISGDLSTYLRADDWPPGLREKYLRTAKRSTNSRGEEIITYNQPGPKGKNTFTGSDYEQFNRMLEIAVQRKYSDLPFGTAGAQWMHWDVVRGSYEPHTAVWPGIENLPRVKNEVYLEAKAAHVASNYMNRNAEIVDLPEAARFFQEGEGGVTKASIEWNAEQQAIIRGYGKADISSFVHEVGHQLRRDLHPEDQGIVELHYGVKEGKWTKGHEERFARDFERYLRDGLAPNDTIRAVFSKIATWMRDIYTTIKGTPLEPKVAPEVRAIFDRALGKVDEPARIEVAPSKVKDPIEPALFEREDPALMYQREALAAEARDLTNQIARTQQDIREVRARAKALKGNMNNLDESFTQLNADGTPRVDMADMRRVQEYTNLVREQYPEFEIESGPRLMNLYQPDSSLLKNLMLENDATAQYLFNWGPGSKMASAISSAVDRWTRPVRSRTESRDTHSRIYEVLMSLGAKKPEVDRFLEGVTNDLEASYAVGIIEKIPLTRGMNGMGANQLTKNAVNAFHQNTEFMANFQRRYGGKGLERVYVTVVEAYNPAIRAIQRKIEQGGKVGRAERIMNSAYDAYHTAPGFNKMAVATHALAKWLYPLWRFTLNPMYHVYNATESDIIGITQDGLRVRRGRTATSAEVFSAVERGNPEAHARLVGQRRKMESMGLRQSEAIDALTDELLRSATLDSTGVTMGFNTRRAAIMERQVDLRRPDTIKAAIGEFAASDPAIQAALKRYGGSVDDWVDGLTQDIYGIDKMGARKYIADLLMHEDGMTRQEYIAMEPLITEISNRMQKNFDDIYHLHVGNISRSRLERVINSYWLMWPASYMIKANRWMFKVLTDGAFGRKTNLGGAWTLNALANEYNRKYVEDPQWRQFVDDNEDLLFALSAVLPVAPWSDGVTLNRLTRYVGGMAGLWPQYTNFNPVDVGVWGAKMADIGPLYSFGLVGDINDSIAKQLAWEGPELPRMPWDQAESAPITLP